MTDLKWQFWRSLNDYYLFVCACLAEYVSTIDHISLNNIIQDPLVDEIIRVRDTIVPEMGTDVIEKIFDSSNKRLMKLLGEPGAIKNNILLPYQLTKQLNVHQVPQITIAFGIRTDVSDDIISYPVTSSALSGLKNISEYAVESLSAKKSQFYNKIAVADAQYMNRKQQLLASAVSHPYQQPCGTHLFVDFYVSDKNHKNIVGKNIYLDGGVLHTIKKNETDQYINRTIRMLSPMTCQYRDGICVRCGGRIMDNLISRNMNIGPLSGSKVISKATQMILSAKHLIKTTSIVYELSAELSGIMTKSSTRDIVWTSGFKSRLKHLMMGVAVRDISNLFDVRLIDELDVKEERFSNITGFLLRNDKDETEYFPMSPEVETKQAPFFSDKMIMHLKQCLDNETIKIENDVIWFPAKGIENIVIFRAPIVNDNMVEFVKNVSRFLSNSIKDYTSVNAALNDFSSIIHEKVSVNIMHMETLLKAYLVTSDSDYRIPRVVDPNNVKFQSLGAILDNRFFGTKLAYERILPMLSHPSTYLEPRQMNIFDYFVLGT